MIRRISEEFDRGPTEVSGESWDSYLVRKEREKRWEQLCECILSEQVPREKIIELFDKNPGFKEHFIKVTK
jgi:hypothetical protein